MNTLAETSRKLSEVSCKSYLNPYSYIDWPDKMIRPQWFMSPELISLYTLPAYCDLNESGRQELSFFEAVNFFSLNIHGEKSLVEGLAHRLYGKEMQEVSAYLHHFLDEENKHMIYFGGFCKRYAGKIYRDRKLALPREYAAGEEDFLFFAKVMIFEEIVDAYNVRMSADERLEPVARKINLVHHLEEARHLVFGRRMLEYLFDKYAGAWQAETLVSVRQYLADYIIACWKEYYNPDVYRDAGLPDPYALVETAWSSESCSKHRRAISARVIEYLLASQMIAEVPQL